MKKIFLIVTAGMLCITSCNDAATDTKSSEQQINIAAADAIAKAFQTGDVSAIDNLVSEDFIDHTDRGDLKGADSLKATVKIFYSNFKDTKAEKIREVADGDYVWSWMQYTGTTVGSAGIPNVPYDIKGIEITKFKNGKAVEHWGFMDMQDVMKMMPQTAANNVNKPDSAK